jgi:hypothetical protein
LTSASARTGFDGEIAAVANGRSGAAVIGSARGWAAATGGAAAADESAGSAAVPGSGAPGVSSNSLLRTMCVAAAGHCRVCALQMQHAENPGGIATFLTVVAKTRFEYPMRWLPGLPMEPPALAVVCLAASAILGCGGTHGGTPALSSGGTSPAAGAGVGGNAGAGATGSGGASVGGSAGTAGASGASTGSSIEATCGPAPVGSCARCTKNPLLRAGTSTGDGRVELSIGDPDVFFDEDEGVWKAWWSTGLAPTFLAPEAQIQMGIKYGTSLDGATWSVQAALTIQAEPGSNAWDQLKLETPSVVKVPWNPPERRYLLAYAGTQQTRTVDLGSSPVDLPWYQLGVAFSADGKTFARLPAAESPYANVSTGNSSIDGLVLLGKDAFPDLPDVADGLLADPELVVDGDTIHLFFSSMPVNAQMQPLAYGISHATSKDGIHFTVQPNNPQVPGAAQPSVVKDPTSGVWELFYVSDTDQEKATEPSTFNPFLGVFRSISSDLSTWSAKPAQRYLTWDPNAPGEVYGLIAAGDMALRDGIHRYYYPGWSTQNVPAGFLCPLRDGTYPAAVIVLDLAIRR